MYPYRYKSEWSDLLSLSSSSSSSEDEPGGDGEEPTPQSSDSNDDQEPIYFSVVHPRNNQVLSHELGPLHHKIKPCPKKNCSSPDTCKFYHQSKNSTDGKSDRRIDLFFFGQCDHQHVAKWINVRWTPQVQAMKDQQTARKAAEMEFLRQGPTWKTQLCDKAYSHQIAHCPKYHSEADKNTAGIAALEEARRRKEEERRKLEEDQRTQEEERRKERLRIIQMTPEEKAQELAEQQKQRAREEQERRQRRIDREFPPLSSTRKGQSKDQSSSTSKGQSNRT